MLYNTINCVMLYNTRNTCVILYNIQKKKYVCVLYDIRNMCVILYNTRNVCVYDVIQQKIWCYIIKCSSQF